MNGVEIINSIEIMKTDFNVVATVIIMVVAFVVVIALWCLTFRKSLDPLVLFIGIMLSFFCMCCCGSCAKGLTMKETPDYIQYEILVDDTVSHNELTNKYELLEEKVCEIDGKSIWIVREKNNDK